MSDFSQIENLFEDGMKTEASATPSIPSPIFPTMPTMTPYPDIQAMIDEAVRLKFKKKKNKLERKIKERLELEYEARLQDEMKKLKKIKKEEKTQYL